MSVYDCSNRFYSYWEVEDMWTVCVVVVVVMCSFNIQAVDCAVLKKKTSASTVWPGKFPQDVVTWKKRFGFLCIKEWTKALSLYVGMPWRRHRKVEGYMWDVLGDGRGCGWGGGRKR